MSRPGWTEKPCPGCGDIRGRRTNNVCNDCRALIEEAKRLREAQAARLDTGRFWHHRRPHSNLYYWRAGDPGILQACFANLIFAVGELTSQRAQSELEPVLKRRDRRESVYYSEAVLLSVTVREALSSLDEAVADQLLAAYRSGHGDGRRLLTALADSKLGLAEFDEQANRVEKAR